jgi:hypothetical protein
MQRYGRRELLTVEAEYVLNFHAHMNRLGDDRAPLANYKEG